MPNIIAPTTRISPLADIEQSSKGSLLKIGEFCFIDAFVKIKFAGGSGDIIIGEKCYFNSGCVLYSGHGIEIGNKVLIAANCTIAPVNHGIKREFTFLEQPHMESKGGIIIEDDVWVGANSVILDGTVIRKGVLVGAGSVVKGELRPYNIYAGNPIKKIGERS